MGTYYDGSRLLSMCDINGKKPEIYISTANRSAGKTTYFNRLMVNRFLNKNEKFCLLYRYNYELDGVEDKFFKDIERLFFKGYEMESKRVANGIYRELSLNGEPCGYAVTMNSSDQIKKYSHLLSDTKSILFDEFQSESNHYCADEVKKFISIHTSIARGCGEQARYVPVYMISNAVSIINPYYIELGICDRLDSKTKYLRGNGFVMEQGFIESASQAQLESGFNSAFGNNAYIAYSTQNIYMNDNKAFIEKPSGKNYYIATIKFEGSEYAIREYPDLGIVYCDNKVDSTAKLRISVTTSDHNVNYVMLNRNEYFIQQLRYFFEKGCFRFKDLRCKRALMTLISY